MGTPPITTKYKSGGRTRRNGTGSGKRTGERKERKRKDPGARKIRGRGKALGEKRKEWHFRQSHTQKSQDRKVKVC